MEFWSILSLIPGLSHLIFGGYVLHRGRKQPLNITFALFAFSLAIWSLSEFGHRQTANPDIAYFCIRFGGLGWCFMASLCTHFILVFARRDRLLKSKLTYIGLYGPSSAILYLFLATNLIYKQEPVRMYFGYTALPGTYVWLYTSHYILLYFFVIYLLLKVLRRGTMLEKKQTKPILFGSAFFLSMTTGTNVMFPWLGISVPELGTTLSIIWSISVFYAVIKHKLFIIEPSIEEPMGLPERYYLERGIGYLVEEKKPDKGYEIFYDQITHGDPGLCITKLNPERVRERYKFAKTPVLWLTFKNVENSIFPRDIDGLLSVFSDFVRKANNSLVFLDCFDQIKFANGFEKSLSLLGDYKRLCKENNSIILVSVSPYMFDKQQLIAVEKELDKVIR